MPNDEEPQVKAVDLSEIFGGPATVVALYIMTEDGKPPPMERAAQIRAFFNILHEASLALRAEYKRMDEWGLIPAAQFSCAADEIDLCIEAISNYEEVRPSPGTTPDAS
jgi:hypothetical protein